MKTLTLMLLFFIAMPLFAEPNKKEPRFFLIPKGSDSETKSFSKVKLYKDPSKGSLIIAELELQWHAPSFFKNMKDLYEGKDVYSYLTVTSSVKKGDFYSVYYKGEYLWINIEDFAYALTWKEYFKYFERDIFFRFDNPVSIYESVKGNKLSWSIVSQHKSKNVPHTVRLPIYSIKVVDDHIWLGFSFGKWIGHSSDVVLDNPIPIWIRAYDDNGKVNNWYYPSKIYFPSSKPDESF